MVHAQLTITFHIHQKSSLLPINERANPSKPFDLQEFQLCVLSHSLKVQISTTNLHDDMLIRCQQIRAQWIWRCNLRLAEL